MNHNCRDRKLVCLDCLKQNAHKDHQDDENLIENMKDQFEKFNEQTGNTASKINQIMNQLVISFEKILKEFEKQFNFSFDMLNNINSTNLSLCIEDIPELQSKRTVFEENFKRIIKHFLDEMSEISNHVRSLVNSIIMKLKNFIRKYNRKDYKTAIEKFGRALIHNPQHLNSLCYKAESLRMQAKYQESIDCCDQALQINSYHTQSLNGKGTSLRMQGKFQECIELFDKVISINPNDVFAMANKGEALRKLNRYNDAIIVLNQVLQIDPNNSLSLCAKGACLVSQQNHAEAQIYLKRALAINQQNEYIQNLLQVCEENILQQTN